MLRVNSTTLKLDKRQFFKKFPCFYFVLILNILLHFVLQIQYSLPKFPLQFFSDFQTFRNLIVKTYICIIQHFFVKIFNALSSSSEMFLRYIINFFIKIRLLIATSNNQINLIYISSPFFLI